MKATWTLKNIKDGSFAYVLQPSASSVWVAVISTELLGTGCTKRYLKSKGWRAVKVSLENPDEIRQLRHTARLKHEYSVGLESVIATLRDEIQRLRTLLYDKQLKIGELEKKVSHYGWQTNPDRMGS